MLSRPNRVQLQLTPNTETLRYDYQSLLLSRVNSWLGKTTDAYADLTENLALYSYSWLRGRYDTFPTGISFPEGSVMRFSTTDSDVLQTLLANIGYDVNVFGGIFVNDIESEPVKDFHSTERFFLSSPALVRTEERHPRQLLYSDPRTEKLMTDIMLRKMEKANLAGDVRISFDTSYRQSKYKTAVIGERKYICSQCPVIVEASSPEVVQFVWAVGVGNCTDAGFGAIL